MIPFRVPRQPRQASIVSPALDSTRVNCPIELLGVAYAPGDLAPGTDLEWSSSLQGPLGRGARLLLESLVPGEHEIILSAPDGCGGQTLASSRHCVSPIPGNSL
jgi:hypothetical protein